MSSPLYWTQTIHQKWEGIWSLSRTQQVSVWCFLWIWSWNNWNAWLRSALTELSFNVWVSYSRLLWYVNTLTLIAAIDSDYFLVLDHCRGCAVGVAAQVCTECTLLRIYSGIFSTATVQTYIRGCSTARKYGESDGCRSSMGLSWFDDCPDPSAGLTA